MTAVPTEVVKLRTGDSTVFLGLTSAYGMRDLQAVASLGGTTFTGNNRDALSVLDSLKRCYDHERF